MEDLCQLSSQPEGQNKRQKEGSYGSSACEHRTRNRDYKRKTGYLRRWQPRQIELFRAGKRRCEGVLSADSFSSRRNWQWLINAAMEHFLIHRGAAQDSQRQLKRNHTRQDGWQDKHLKIWETNSKASMKVRLVWNQTTRSFRDPEKEGQLFGF